MADAFQPLMPGKGIPIPSASGGAAGFQPILAAIHAGSAGASPDGCKPEITLQRDGDRVTQIRVRCGCGQVIELGCVY